MSDRMPDEISEYMSAQMPDDCQQECQNIRQIECQEKCEKKWQKVSCFSAYCIIYNIYICLHLHATSVLYILFHCENCAIYQPCIPSLSEGDQLCMYFVFVCHWGCSPHRNVTEPGWLPNLSVYWWEFQHVSLGWCFSYDILEKVFASAHRYIEKDGLTVGSYIIGIFLENVRN